MFVRFAMVIVILVVMAVLGIAMQQPEGVTSAFAAQDDRPSSVVERFAAGRNAAQVRHDLQESRRNYYESGIDAATP